VLSGVLVWFGLTAPDRLDELTPAAFLRLPLEAVLLSALVLVLPDRARRVAATVAGLVLGLLTVAKLLDMAFFETLDRPFDPDR
jgi:hypothetical protein